MSMEQEVAETPDIGGEHIGGDEARDAARPETDGAASDDQDTPEERADERSFQSKYDKLQARVRELEQFAGGNLDEIETFIRNTLPIVQRQDFQDYVSGSLAKPQESDADDEYLTVEQKEIRSLRSQLDQITKRLDTASQSTSREIAGVRFEQAEKALVDRVGKELWERQRTSVMREVQNAAARGQLTPDRINDKTLMSLFMSSFDDTDDMENAIRHIAARKEAAAKEGRRVRSTNLPDNGAAAAEIPSQPKTIAEAWALGKQMAAERSNGVN